MKKLILMLWLALASLSCFAQNGNNYAKGFAYIGTLAGIPSTCSVGQIAFVTDATAGQNIYECASTNTWTQQVSGAGFTPPVTATQSDTTHAVLTLKRANDGTPGTSYFNIFTSNDGLTTLFSVDVLGNAVANSVAVGASPPSCGASATGCLAGTEAATGATVASGLDTFRADSSSHCWKQSLNNAAEVCTPELAGDLGNTAASPQVTSTHLAAALPVNQGGTATTSTLTGVVRGGNPMTAAELSGDCATSGSNAVICTQINGPNFTVNSSGLPTKVDGITTAGQGVDIVQCITSAKVETGADASVLSCTPASAVGGYEVCVAIDVSAANTATLGWTATWTNTKTNANAPTNLSLFQMGVAAPALTFTAAANNSYYACVPIGVSAAGTSVVVKTTFSGTSIAYNVSAWIKRAI